MLACRAGTERNVKTFLKKTKEEEEEEILDLMYPTMKDKDKDKKAENDNKQNKPAFENSEKSENKNEDKTLLLKAHVEKSDLKQSDQNFQDSMGIVFQHEGAFSDHKHDKGGRTNLGITQRTYDDYCKRHGLKTKDVKNITENEAREVYYNDYWKASGADKIEDPVHALVVFDMAVNQGPGRAKQLYKKANGNIEKFMELRENLYKQSISQNQNLKTFEKGWKNRMKSVYDLLNNSESDK